MPGAGLLAHVVTGKIARRSAVIPPVRKIPSSGVELSRATLGAGGAVAELLEPLYDVLRQYVLMPGKVHADDIPVPVQEQPVKPGQPGCGLRP
ncbi:IS66 family transposase [Escherichia coli]